MSAVLAYKSLHGSAPLYLVDELFITDCQPYSTVHRQWPGFSGRCCSCSEQSSAL